MSRNDGGQQGPKPRVRNPICDLFPAVRCTSTSNPVTGLPAGVSGDVAVKTGVLHNVIKRTVDESCGIAVNDRLDPLRDRSWHPVRATSVVSILCEGVGPDEAATFTPKLLYVVHFQSLILCGLFMCPGIPIMPGARCLHTGSGKARASGFLYLSANSAIRVFETRSSTS